MYRHANKASKNINKSNSNLNHQTLQEIDDSDPVQKIPDLRRIVVITDYMTLGNQKLTNLSYTKLIVLTAARCWLMGDFGKIELDGPIFL